MSCHVFFISAVILVEMYQQMLVGFVIWDMDHYMVMYLVWRL